MPLFGHGTMVLGVIHLVAPTAQLLPLKAFHSDGTGNLSDILRRDLLRRADNANAINMSFDFKTASTELQNALDYANQLNVICAASAGNDGQGPPPHSVYPAELQNDVMAWRRPATRTPALPSQTWKRHRVVAAPGESDRNHLPVQHLFGGMGNVVQRAFVSGAGGLLRNPADRYQ